MNIAIIGAGNVGRALSTSSVRAGHSVVISATDPAHARDAAESAGAKAASSNAEAVGAAEVVILAVPVDAAAPIVDELGPALDGKVVVDVTNRVNPDDPGAVLDGTSTAETLQSRVPSARVVKAFNPRSRPGTPTPSSTGCAWTVTSPATTPRRRRPCYSSWSRSGSSPSTSARWPCRERWREWG